MIISKLRCVLFSIIFPFFYLCSMNQLILHIEYLLHQHNCVIVPGLGGFVVNSIHTRKEDLSIFHSPYCELVFNRSLTHNDGLLVESYMRVDNIPFESANIKIEQAVKELKGVLRYEKRVSLGDLGEFILTDDNRFIYNPKRFIRPEFFGLSVASLKPVIQLKPKASISAKPIIEKRKSLPKISMGAAIAAMIAIMFFIFPIQDTEKEHQSAKMLTDTNIFAKTERQKNRNNVFDSYAVDTSANHDAYSSPDSNKAKETTLAKTDKQYYIIVGVYEVREIADKMIERLKSDGYNNCNTIDKPTRIDVYAASFSSRKEAEKVARELRDSNDIYKDAWVK